jgi:hypothetical protein
MLEVVPLNTWEVAWNLPPDEIIATCDRSEWNNEFPEAWTRAATRQQNAVWAEALLTKALEAGQMDKLSSLLQVMPAQRREAIIAQIFHAKGPNADQFRGELVALCTHSWSADFSRMVLAWLRELTTRDSSDWQLRSRLKEMASLLAPETLAEASTGWKTDQPAWEFWGKGVDEFLATVQFRAACHQHLNL